MNKKFFCRDRVLSIILLAISAFFAIQANGLRASNLDGDPGPKVFPWMACGLLVACAIYLFIKPGTPSKKMNLSKEEWKRLVIMLALYLFIVLGTIYIGIIYTLPIALFFISYLFSKSSKPELSTKKRLIQTLIYTVAISAALYLIYVVALGVNLKPGKLF